MAYINNWFGRLMSRKIIHKLKWVGQIPDSVCERRYSDGLSQTWAGVNCTECLKKRNNNE